jgi:restriction system protein
MLLCLINQASYLLHRQLERLEQDFLTNGGFTERLYAGRTRQRNLPSNLSVAPLCPRCGKPMHQRVARHGPDTGLRFWGCSSYPDCKATRPLSHSADPSQ